MIAHVHLSSAEILALFDTPIEIVPAPDPGKTIVPVTGYWQKHLNTTPYVVAGRVDFFFNDIPGLSDGTDYFGLSTNHDVTGVQPAFYSADAIDAADAFAGQPLLIKASGANPTVGDGNLDVWVVYMIADAP